MSELDPSRDELISYLTADYTTPENLVEILEDEGRGEGFGMSLTAFLAHTRDEETVEERLRSGESTQIGNVVNELLQDSYITESFKDFIVNAVRHAHAYETAVSDEVSTSQLRVDVGLGIFEAEQAPEVEAQNLRGRLFNIVSKYILMVEAADGQRTPVIMHAASYSEEMSVLNAWLVDYINTFGRDPFTDIEMEAYLLAATTAKEAAPEQNQQMQQILNNLQAIRDKKEDIPRNVHLTKYTPEERQQVAELLDKKVGTYMGNVFLTALDLFPDFDLLQSAKLDFRSDFDRFVGVVNDQGEPMVVLSTDQEIVTPRLRSRIIKRFGLPESLRDAPSSLFRLFVFAHELGHILQADGKFEEYFGEIDHTVYSPEEDYSRYVESDHEANADYIAALIISRSEIGNATGYPKPDKDLLQWREWASQHRVAE